MIPNQFMWWLVFGTHTILWTGGWMGSAGLLRIIACVTPFAAITILKGWNIIIPFIQKKITRKSHGYALSVLFVTCTGFYALYFNYIIPLNHYGRITYALKNDFAEHKDSAVILVSSDAILNEITSIDPFDKRHFQNLSDHPKHIEEVKNLPIGTLILWDDQRGLTWHGLKCDDLEGMGYKIIKEHTIRLEQTYYGSPAELHGVVAIKVK